MRPLAFAVVFGACFSSLGSALAAPDTPWAADRADVSADLAKGNPLVVEVVIPLCSNDQIDCGGALAGKPRDLGHNLYWGALFGARRFFERRGSDWTRVELTSSAPGLLERAIYRRSVSGAAFGLEGDIEELVVLEAVDGSAIDAAVERFWIGAASGRRVAFEESGRKRNERVHVIGYSGHDRLMDKPTKPTKGKTPIPSFVLACYSDEYFTKSLDSVGSTPLLTTSALMAPEGYLADAVAHALGENLSARLIRERAVEAYAKWQRLSHKTASSIFAPSR